MEIAIRVDASVAIGAGHVMRCITLASELAERDVKSLFVCREHEGHLCEMIQDSGFSVSRLPRSSESRFDDLPAHASWLATSWQRDAHETVAALRAHGQVDLLIVDHYGVEHRWERQLSKAGMRVAVLDDLADRAHICEMIVDANCLPNQQARYAGLIPENCIKLFGPRFLLLRKQFLEARTRQRARDGVVRRALVFFGSADKVGYTSRVMHHLPDRLQVDVVVGSANPQRCAIQALCEEAPRYRYHSQVTNMAELMSAADIAISAGGLTSYELAYMGVPSILFPLSDIQSQVSAELAAQGAAMDVGFSTTFPAEKFALRLQALLESPARCAEMARAARNLFDGLGARRIASALIGNIYETS